MTNVVSMDDKHILAKWKPVHGVIARLTVQGLSPKDIAKAVGYNIESIYRLHKSPLMQAEIRRLEGTMEDIMIDADLRLKSLIHRAIDVIQENLGEPLAGIPHKSPDREALTKDAKFVIDQVMGQKKRGESLQVNLGVNVQTLVADAQKMDRAELVKSVTGMIKETHDA